MGEYLLLASYVDDRQMLENGRVHRFYWKLTLEPQIFAGFKPAPSQKKTRFP